MTYVMKYLNIKGKWKPNKNFVFAKPCNIPLIIYTYIALGPYQFQISHPKNNVVFRPQNAWRHNLRIFFKSNQYFKIFTILIIKF